MNRSVEQRFDDLNRNVAAGFSHVGERFVDMKENVDKRFDDLNKKITLLIVVASPIVVAFVGIAIALLQLVWSKT